WRCCPNTVQGGRRAVHDPHQLNLRATIWAGTILPGDVCLAGLDRRAAGENQRENVLHFIAAFAFAIPSAAAAAFLSDGKCSDKANRIALPDFSHCASRASIPSSDASRNACNANACGSKSAAEEALAVSPCPLLTLLAGLFGADSAPPDAHWAMPRPDSSLIGLSRGKSARCWAWILIGTGYPGFDASNRMLVVSSNGSDFSQIGIQPSSPVSDFFGTIFILPSSPLTISTFSSARKQRIRWARTWSNFCTICLCDCFGFDQESSFTASRLPSLSNSAICMSSTPPSPAHSCEAESTTMTG